MISRAVSPRCAYVEAHRLGHGQKHLQIPPWMASEFFDVLQSVSQRMKQTLHQLFHGYLL
jgi:hypothetical protein